MSEMPAAARPIRRRVITRKSTRARRARPPTCARRPAACRSQAHDDHAAPRRARRRGRPRRRRRQARRLPGPVRRRPARRDPRDGSALRARQPDAVERHRRGPGEASSRPTSAQPQGPFFEKQLRVATENFGRVDPESLDDYLERGGYEALRRVLSEMTSAEVRDEITRSGLRGRGGAGYPDRPQVDHRRQGPGQPQVRDLQRRRGRPRGVHGSQRPRERPVPGPRGDGHRRLRGPRQRGLHLLPRGVPARGGPPPDRDPERPAGRLPRPGDRRHRRSASTSRSAWAPAPSSAARRPRSSRPSRARRGTPRPRPPYPAVSGPVGPAHAHQQRRVVRQRADDPPQGPRLVRGDRPRQESRAPRSSPWPAGS